MVGECAGDKVADARRGRIEKFVVGTMLIARQLDKVDMNIYNS